MRTPEMIFRIRFLIVLLVAAPMSFALAEEKSAAIGDLLESARKNLQAENFAGAHAALDQFEKANQRTVESLDLRGCVYMEQGNFTEAAKAFEAAHAIDFAAFPPRIHAADLLLRQKKFAEARDAYEKLLSDTNIPSSSERLRYGILITELAEHDERGARSALDSLSFPTQTPAYYYAQAASAFAHGKKSEARKWIETAERIFPSEAESWFARPLYELGWIKKKPPPVLYQSI
jgi:tetratricopeptide (TPR) repeat protein